MTNRKYSLIEFIAACESENFDIIEEGWLEWATNFANYLPTACKEDKPFKKGTIGISPITALYNYLEDYHDYFDNETEWREANL